MMRSLIFLMLVFSLLGCEEYTNERLIHGRIVDVGSCGGGEGFFSGSYECKVAVSVDGRIEYWSVYGQTIKGQPVSRACRDKQDGTTWCGTGR